MHDVTTVIVHKGESTTTTNNNKRDAKDITGGSPLDASSDKVTGGVLVFLTDEIRAYRKSNSFCVILVNKAESIVAKAQLILTT